jgi:transcriptional regulator with XRE-family HTH domain
LKKSTDQIDKYVGSRVRMRRMMLEMSQTELGDSLGLTFQQVQKYEKGTNRIGASRIHQLSQILQVPISFFFDGAPIAGRAPPPAYVPDFLCSSDGLRLAQAFMGIKSVKLRQHIVNLVKEIESSED